MSEKTTTPATRQRNDGLRKICTCPRRTWAKCSHPWHFSFKWKDTHHRFSLNRHLGREIDSKTTAEAEAEKIRIAIREGRFGQPAPVSEMTLRQLADLYLERYVEVERAATAANFRGQLHVICQTGVAHPTGANVQFGAWRVSDLVSDSVARFAEVRRATGAGVGGTNRNLSRLRALFNWAIRVGYAEATPFKRHGVSAVRLARETPRSRRLNDAAEETALLAACGPHLRGVVEAALETGMRRGEVLGLQWRHVEGMQLQDDNSVTWGTRPEVVLPAARTKTRTARRIPISKRLQGVLELRRLDPAGQPLPPEGFVFGTEIGTRVLNIKRAWATAVLKAHGHKATYTKGANLSPGSRKVLAAIDLHFHDLRREAGSRWMDAGVPIATIQRWLGHANVSQTSTYLAGAATSEHDAMRRFEAHQERLQLLATGSETGGRKSPQTATAADEKPNETAAGYKPAIM